MHPVVKKCQEVFHFHVNSFQSFGKLSFRPHMSIHSIDYFSLEMPSTLCAGSDWQVLQLNPSRCSVLMPPPPPTSFLPPDNSMIMQVITSCQIGFYPGYKLICFNWFYFQSNVENAARDGSQ